MTRDECIDLLARLVADDDLTELDAADLLAQFDAGEITDVPSVLPLAEAIREPSDDNTGLAIVALLILLTSRRQTVLRRFAPITSLNLANAIQDTFAGRVTALAGRLATGDLVLAQWQRTMLDEVEIHTLQQMFLANGNQVLTGAQQARLRTIVQEQGAYLQRFADQAALRIGQGTPFTEGYLANRATLYAGAGRGEYFRSNTEAMLARGDITGDVLIYYISRDDRNTCSPCLDAEHRGPYRVDSPYPVPGQVCLGAGSCRCTLEYRYESSARRT